MAAALDADRDAELHRALDAVVDIARARYATLTAAPRRTSVIELGAEPLRQGGHPARPRRRAAPDGDRVRDLTVAVALEGDFAAAHTDGDNALVVATDTMKNTAYAFATDHLDGSIEDYGRALAEHFLEAPQVDARRSTSASHHWRRDRRRRARRRRDAFVRGGEGTRVATVAATPRRDDGRGRRRGPRRDEDDALGVQRLPARPVHDAARDRRPADGHEGHRDLALRLARPRRRRDVRGRPPTLLEVFADHDSPSVQTSIWIMARAILERHEEVEEVRMVLPNLHHWLVDLSPFGLTNDREIYTPTTEPHGLIEATVRRGEG